MKPKLNIPDPKSPPVQSPGPGSRDDTFNSTRSSEGDEYATPRVKEIDTVSIALSANLGEGLLDNNKGPKEDVNCFVKV